MGVHRCCVPLSVLRPTEVMSPSRCSVFISYSFIHDRRRQMESVNIISAIYQRILQPPTLMASFEAVLALALFHSSQVLP